MTENEAALRRRFDDLVLWYVNGTLSPSDRAWVEAYLREHPEAQHELQWHQQLKRSAMRAGEGIPSDVGLANLMAQAQLHDRSTQRSLWQRLKAFSDALTQSNLRPAFAGAALLVMVQALGLAFLAHEVVEQKAQLREYSETRAVDTGANADGVSINVSFKNNATERSMRALMISVQGRIVDGPDQLGRYVLVVPPEQLDTARAQLESSPIVEWVAIKRPPSARN